MSKENIVQQPATSAAQKHFSEVPFADVERSTFDRSSAWKSTIREAGQLIPCYWDEVLPGDTFTMDASIFVRLSTPLKPFMDNLQIDCNFFFVPTRVVWINWLRFCGEELVAGDDPDDWTIPQATLDLKDVSNQESIADYLGLPVGTGGNISVSDIPFRVYQEIWNEWYRDQNIQNPDPPGKLDVTVDRNGFMPKRTAKRHDYFSSCLPWPQKGEAVTIPIGESAAVRLALDDATPENLLIYRGGDGKAYYLDANPTTGDVTLVGGSQEYSNGQELIADLTSATAVSINDLRTAFQIQRLLERDARGGTRYPEIILSHFGVQTDDARVQRPEWIGAATGMLNINPVAATATDPSAPQGNLAATGTGLCRGKWTKSFTEHGIVMGVMRIRGDQTYQQGIDRYWSRLTRYEFYWPALSHLGEQAVLQKEIYTSGVPAEDDLVFGYQERYGEMRYRPGRVCGVFRSSHPESLDVWHLAQDFDSAPVLNSAFLNDQPAIARAVAVPSEPHFFVDAWFDLKSTRPMPMYSEPGFVDHL